MLLPTLPGEDKYSDPTKPQAPSGEYFARLRPIKAKYNKAPEAQPNYFFQSAIQAPKDNEPPVEKKQEQPTGPAA